MRLLVITRFFIRRIAARIARLTAHAIALLGAPTATAATAPAAGVRVAGPVAAVPTVAAVRAVLLLWLRGSGGKDFAFLDEARARFADLVFVGGGLVVRLLLLRTALLLLRALTRLLVTLAGLLLLMLARLLLMLLRARRVRAPSLT